MPQHAKGEDFAQDIQNIDSSSAADLTDSDSDQSNDDLDLLYVCTTIAAPPLNASVKDLRKASLYVALELAQRLLLVMQGKYREALKKNTLLEATLSKGWKTKLTNKDLALAAKEDTIKNYGHKFSITHCLWVDTMIFPLCAPPPRIDLTSKEWWLSPMSIQDGVKAKIFLFILPADHNMMAHKNFGSHFVKGVNSVCAKMVSDVKSCAAAIFNLDAKFSIRGYAQDLEPARRTLLLNPQDNFFKTSKLVYILKVFLFGLSSLAANVPPMPKTKAKIWELRAITPGLIAVAAIVAILILSGDKELVNIGDKSRILYKEYHNYYRQTLMTSSAWADSIYTFFNNSLFATSFSVAVLGSDFVGVSSGPHNTWEEDFEHVMETGGDLPEVDAPRAMSPLTDKEDTPSSAVYVTNLNAPILTPGSISVAMQALAVADSQDCKLLPPTTALNDSGSCRAPGLLTNNEAESGPGALIQKQKPKPKPKPRRKTKAGAIGAEDLMLDAADEDLALMQRSGCSKK
ncbi:uncharacterized protein F5891DRAFT_1187428 [Suillus fuscotomentosus]|uniref:Uncharacterized protein n=1 Tax=Suillus fuscotomentosus TaxID=1912939 RepID=A0AAD4E8A8_9AGAM|nr:uncharacterized protein F5891DRAFT_1187428 [Suillus fuscotomentosus]KAG1901568.1 hypothetical protein F5891DRAFT_1187428 [Suillus fuscotomentosus]